MSLQNNQFRPTLEFLETRNLMASLQASISGGYLYIQGSGGADYIGVNQSGSYVSVYGNTILYNGRRVGSVSTNAFSGIIVHGNAGSDTVVVSSAVTRPAYVY